jgi:CheY-like chemotaxis protein
MSFNHKVLIVDDSPILRRAVTRAVIQAGLSEENIREAGNGQEALEALKSAPSDLVLLDLNMPVMDGWEFAKAALADSELSKTAIIVVSTESNQKRIESMRQLGIRGFLHKPFEPEDLRKLVEALLGG